jgi:hypothetical protein
MMNRMKPKTALMAMSISVISSVLTITAAWAADSVTFSESYLDKAVCSGDKADGYMCETYPTGKFSLKANFSFGPSNTIDVATLNTNTAVSIAIGGWTLDAAGEDNPAYYTLGDATTLKFKASAKKGTNSVTATFLLIDDVAYDADCDTAPKLEGQVTLTINQTELTASVSANTGEDNLRCQDDLESSPVAANFEDDPTGLTNATVTVSISVGQTFSISTDLAVDVNVLTVTTIDGDTQASRISVKGSGKF